MANAHNIIKAETVMRDGCPALGRTRAFIIKSGVLATLEHQFVDNEGNPTSLELSGDPPVAPGVVMRIREETGIAGQCGPVYESTGLLEDAANGIAQTPLPSQIACSNGIYRADWACLDDDGNPTLINSTLVSVERSLFDTNNATAAGMPSLSEIRAQIMDTAADNTLLDDVEFTDEQILQALLKPIADWDESLPPIGRRFTTRNFPWRNKWIDASLGYLYRFAAAQYRRNRFISSGGGKQIDDKNKEREYLAISAAHLEEWEIWKTRKKISLNARAFHGSSRSYYGY